MPGLRHAHTLQQLKSVIEYSPPGEYLNNIEAWQQNNLIITTTKYDKIEDYNTILKKDSIIIFVVVVVCEHGVSPALKNPEVSNYEIHVLPSSDVSTSWSLSLTFHQSSYVFHVRTAQSFLW